MFLNSNEFIQIPKAKFGILPNNKTLLICKNFIDEKNALRINTNSSSRKMYGKDSDSDDQELCVKGGEEKIY